MNYLNIFIFLAIILVPCVIVLDLFIRSSFHFGKKDTLTPAGGNPLQLSQELEHLHLPPEKAEETARAVTQIVNREVENRVEKIKTEVKHTYQKVIETYDKKIEAKDRIIQEVQKSYEAVQQNYKVLGKEKKQTESVVKSIAKGMIVINDNGEVVFVNPIAEKILGIRAENLIGKSINNTEGEHVISLVNEEGNDEGSKNHEAKEMLKESTAIIQGESGQTRGVVSILAGTMQKKKIDDYKTEFLANITHELRSPLVCIQKSISIINEELKNASAEHKNYLNIALRNAERLENLVNDILDISKMEAGKMALRYEFIPAKAFVEDIRSMLGVWAKDKNIQIVEKVEDGLIFEADPERLRQVVVNLGANALKFTPRGGKITFEVKQTEEGGQQRIQFGIQDSGPGLSEDDIKNLFQKFNSSLNASEGERGTGLGLTIAKEIVELHKGKIWAQNGEARGAYFGFWVPKDKAKSEQPAPPQIKAA